MSLRHVSPACREYHDLVVDFGGSRPTIVVICGSSRFKDEINAANARLTLAGNLVLSLGVFAQTDMADQDWSTGATPTKVGLDELHKRKIDMADMVYVVDPAGYVGESTRGEIEYAEKLGKPVTYLSQTTDGPTP